MADSKSTTNNNNNNNDNNTGTVGMLEDSGVGGGRPVKEKRQDSAQFCVRTKSVWRTREKRGRRKINVGARRKEKQRTETYKRKL